MKKDYTSYIDRLYDKSMGIENRTPLMCEMINDWLDVVNTNIKVYANTWNTSTLNEIEKTFHEKLEWVIPNRQFMSDQQRYMVDEKVKHINNLVQGKRNYLERRHNLQTLKNYKNPPAPTRRKFHSNVCEDYIYKLQYTEECKLEKTYLDYFNKIAKSDLMETEKVKYQQRLAEVYVSRAKQINDKYGFDLINII